MRDGGQARREREMLRRLEELDRLDALASSPDEVVWPGGRSSRDLPRDWRPGFQESPPSSPRRSRFRSIRIVLVVAAVLGLLVPRIPGWVGDLLTGEPEYLASSETAADAGAAPPGGAVAGGRLRPAVVVDEVPPPDHYSFMRTQGSGDPVTFDPCRVIHYVVRDAPTVGEAGRDVVARAVTEVSLATGLAFVFDGYTDEGPSAPSRTSPRSASATDLPVLIAWSSPEETPDLEGDTVGIGGGLAVRDVSGHLTYVSGTARLDTPALAGRLGSKRGDAEVQAVVMHELAHVVGAGHAESDDEIMSPSTSNQLAFGAGDLYALSVLGQGRCG